MVLARYATAKKRIKWLSEMRSFDMEDTAKTLLMSHSDIPMLVNALKVAEKTCPNGGNDGYITPRPCQIINCEECNLKTRAEVLERALTGDCGVCIHSCYDFEYLKDGERADCAKWQFDEQRFLDGDNND